MINLLIALITLPPFTALAWFVIQRYPYIGIHAWRIRIAAWSLIVLCLGLIVYFSIEAM